MRILNSGEKDREIQIIAEKLPDMLFQKNRHPYLNTVTPQSSSNNLLHIQNQTNAVRNIYSQQSNIRPRKGTAFNMYDTSGNFSDSKIFDKKKGVISDYGSQKTEPVSLCMDLEWANSARDYCQRSTLHGLRYVGDEELHIGERFFWTIAFACGVIAAIYFISELYRRWDENPMIISLSPKAAELESIPFPAVTICNMNGAKKSVAETIQNNQDNNFQSRFEKEMLADLCGENLGKRQRLAGNWTKIQKFMIKVSQPCHEMVIDCKWGSKTYACTDLFNPETTDEGMCCSFNKVERNLIYRNPRQMNSGMNYTYPFPAIDWTPEMGYPPESPVNGTPWRPFGAGKFMGLSVVLDADLENYYCSSTASIGFKLLLHNPVETPKVSDFAYFLSPGLETRVEIMPKISTSTRSLENIRMEKRMCYFSTERELRFYRTYTQRNCDLECQSNFTLSKCGCVPFYLPKDFNTRICGTSDYRCVGQAKEFTEFRIQEDPTNTTGWDKEEITKCSCLPSCVQIRYGKQMSSSKLEDTFKINENFLNGRDPAYFKKNMAVVHFFFVENSFTVFEKGEIFGFTDFLSNTGGLLGLFLGFSIMSAAEILYFMTLRLFCMWRSKKQKHKRDENAMRAYPFAQ